jgi:hypothetical protein
MQNIKYYIGGFLTIVLLIFGIYHYRNEVKRLQNNYDVLALNKDNAERLYKNEVKLYYYSIDSLRKALNVRGKTVQTIFKTVVSFRDSVNFKDSTITILDTIPYLTTDRVIKKPCYDLYLYENHELLNYHDVFTGFLHWERKYKLWFIHYGHKEYYLKLYSQCQMDTIKVDKLIMVE